jgi:hypothetical protein
MPCWLSSQSSGPQGILPGMTGMQAVKALVGAVVCVGLQYTGSVWQFNLWGGAGWVNCPKQDQYCPPIFVRQVSLLDATNTNRSITFDLAGDGETAIAGDSGNYPYQLGIDEILATNVGHARHITRVWLGATTATSIRLYG